MSVTILARFLDGRTEAVTVLLSSAIQTLYDRFDVSLSQVPGGNCLQRRLAPIVASFLHIVCVTTGASGCF